MDCARRWIQVLAGRRLIVELEGVWIGTFVVGSVKRVRGLEIRLYREFGSENLQRTPALFV
jgi:hypothetical protein